MVTSSHGAQLCRFWVIEKQILLAAGSTGYNSVADVVVGPSLGFPLCKIIVYFKPSSTWKEWAQQVPVEGWKGRFLGQEPLPAFPTGIFSPCCIGLDILELVLVPAAQLGVLLVVVGDLHLKPKPVIAVAWVGSSPPAFLGHSPGGNSPKMPWSPSQNSLGTALGLPVPAGLGGCLLPQNKSCHLGALQPLELISNKWLFLPLSHWNPALCSFLKDAELSPLPWCSRGSNKVWDGVGSAHEEETLDLWSCFNPESHSGGGNPWAAKAPAGLSLWILPWENSWGYSCSTAPSAQCPAKAQILNRGKKSQRNSGSKPELHWWASPLPSSSPIPAGGKSPSCFSDPTGNSKVPFKYLFPTFLPASLCQCVAFPVWLKRGSVCQSHQVEAGTGCPSQDFSLKQRHLSIYFLFIKSARLKGRGRKSWHWNEACKAGWEGFYSLQKAKLSCKSFDNC